MIIFPAIDLKQGKCVRLYQGDMNQATVFSDSPKDQALAFQNEGADWLHIVDLDGAVNGRSENIEVVKDIIKNVDMNIQLGGGIRDLEAIKFWLDLGIKRVILGTIALKNPEIVKQACKKFPNQIVVGIDAKDGMVATEGWVETSEISVIELAKKFEDAGVSAIVYTDIAKDGTLQGPDLNGTKQLAESVNIPVIASGGVANLEDIKTLKTIEPSGINGVITGRALYEKKFTLKQAINVVS